MSRELETIELRHAYNGLKFCAAGDTDAPELIPLYERAAGSVGELLGKIMVECTNFTCGTCHIVQYPGMFGEETPPDSEGILFAGEMSGNEESTRCTKKLNCEAYEPRE